MMSVPGWESLGAADAIARLPELSDEQLEWVEARESGRVAVLHAVLETRSQRRGAASASPRRRALDIPVTKD